MVQPLRIGVQLAEVEYEHTCPQLQEIAEDGR